MRIRPLLTGSCAAVLSVALCLTGQACGGPSDGPGPASASPGPAAANAVTASAAPGASQAASQEPDPSAPTPEPSDTSIALPGDAIATEPAPSPEPASVPLSLLTVVDKQHALPSGYEPEDLAPLAAPYLAPGSGGSLRAEARAALEGMLTDASGAGFEIYVRSAYRSFAEQDRTFAYWVSALGEDEARRVSAEPGHSEHQLGTAADLTSADAAYDLSDVFGETPAGRWLAENSHRYGFALSYPAGAEAVTGYAYEPWHFRYIGPEHAAAWRASGLTLVEYLRSVEG